jgi:predicted ATPase
MLLCLARDELLERRTGWGGGRHDATSIMLEPLTVRETQELVEALLPPSAQNGDGAVKAIAERAGGNPFFAEEMARRIADKSGGLSELPDTVQGLLAARLDSLEPLERRLVQHAAVVGRTFWKGALAAAVPDDRQLHKVLLDLQEKDIIVPDETMRLAGEPEYAFKHVLIRDVAYGMLPKSVRWRKHFEVGRFIEERAGERADEVVPLLAEHYGRAATLSA